MPRASKGQRFGGRIKGTPNKVTAEIKDMVRAALDAAGGVEYLKRQATISPAAFMSLIAKIIPADVNAKLSGDVRIEIVRYTDTPPST